MHLFIDTYGTSIRLKNGTFEVKHHEGIDTFAPEKIKALILSRGVSITTDVILTAIKFEIEVIFLDSNGMPQGRIWSQHYGSIATIRKQQALFLSRPACGQFVKSILVYKAESQAALLESLAEKRKSLATVIKSAIETIRNVAKDIATVDATNIVEVSNQLRGYEGAASKAYFSTLGMIIPEPYSFKSRSKMPAKDPFNAVLNYLYGMLYSRIEGDLIMVGLDPYLGIFHSEMYKRPVLVYDFIERFRTWADSVAIRLFLSKLFDESCYNQEPEPHGGIWLSGTGKKLVVTAFNEYMAQVIDYQGTRRSRAEHIRLFAQKFSSNLQALDKSPNEIQHI